MAETGTAVPRAAGLSKLLSYFVDSKAGWKYGLYRIDDLAQDQVAFEVDRGQGYEVYRGVRVLPCDAQSEVAPALAGSEQLHAIMEAMRTSFLTYGDVEDRFFDPEDEPDLDEPGEELPGDGGDLADEGTAGWSADELTRRLLDPKTEQDWPHLRKLLQMSEDTGFSLEQSQKVAPRLLDLAARYRDSNDPQDKPAVWSAIRTGASMLRPDEADRLRPLLEPGHPIETSLVAVKMLGRIFEVQPPADVDRHLRLAADVRVIASSLLNAYAIASSQSAATAQLAIYALAAMASSNVIEVVGVVRGLPSWFAQQTCHELRELRGYWSNPSANAGAGPRELLEQALRELYPIS